MRARDSFFLGLVAVGFIHSFSALAAETTPPDDLAQWGTVCFCLKARKVPQTPLRLDNNGQILFHARDGITRDELQKRGIAASDSQLYLLQSFNLLEKQGAIYRTRFPILGPVETAGIRSHLSELARAMAPQVSDDVARIVAQLRYEGFPEHAYAVVFSYVLDGLIWDELRARNALPSIELTPENPLWNGAFWAFYPKRENAAGTNEYQGGAFALQMLWTDSVVAPLNDLAAAPGLKPFLNAAGAETAVVAPIKDQAGRRWTLINEQGIRQIPLIHRVPANIIHHAGHRIATIMADGLGASPQAQTARRLIPRTTEQQATLILAHEFMWFLQEELEKSRHFEKPPVLNGTAPVNSDTLRPLIYLVR